MTVSLHHGIGQQNDRVENDVHAHDGHKLRGKCQIFTGIAAKQRSYRACKYGKSESTGHTDQSGDTGGRLFRCLGGLVVQQCQVEVMAGMMEMVMGVMKAQGML